MEIFVTKGGEKLGPFQVFELKNRVDAGDFSGDDLAWTKGMESWVPLREIEALEWMVAEPEEEPPPLPEQEEVTVVRPWVRFWARMVDWNLMGVLIGLVAHPFGGLGMGVTAMAIVSITFGWGLLEAVILSRWGTTPGKYLLGVWVEVDREEGG
ncbi:MAG: RDD family protein, partial [Verrucomicrobiales bacterium]|nr:RDD family protein [Verrucomicrobiales bacterium]